MVRATSATVESASVQQMKKIISFQRGALHLPSTMEIKFGSASRQCRTAYGRYSRRHQWTTLGTTCRQVTNATISCCWPSASNRQVLSHPLKLPLARPVCAASTDATTSLAAMYIAVVVLIIVIIAVVLVDGTLAKLRFLLLLKILPVRCPEQCSHALQTSCHGAWKRASPP